MKKLALLTSALLSLPTYSATTGLMGDEIDISYLASDNSEYSYHVTVTDGIELNSFASLGRIDVQENTISVDITCCIGLGPGPSWHFKNLDFAGNSAGIGSVSVSTNYTDWNDNYLSYDAHNIHINFYNGVYWNRFSDYFVISITEVPVPAAAWLFSSGLIGFVSTARKRKST